MSTSDFAVTFFLVRMDDTPHKFTLEVKSLHLETCINISNLKPKFFLLNVLLLFRRILEFPSI